MNNVSPFWIGAVLLAAGFAAMAALETAHPLRRRLEPRLRRTIRNFTTAAIALAVITFLQAPILMPLVHWTERHGVGLLKLARLPAAVEAVIAILLLDYTLWHWH